MRFAFVVAVLFALAASCARCSDDPAVDPAAARKSTSTLAQDQARKEINADNAAAKLAELDAKIDAELRAERAAPQAAAADGGSARAADAGAVAR
jgi:hypothetical protein